MTEADRDDGRAGAATTLGRFGADPGRLLLGDPAGGEHLLDTTQERLAVPAAVAVGTRTHGSGLSRHYVYVKSRRRSFGEAYPEEVPRLWKATIEAHRHDVREAILDTAAALVAQQGLLSVTMSSIAEQTGIGRATLYKYFPDVEAILRAWHERQVAGHLRRLAEVRDQPGMSAAKRLEAMLRTYAENLHESRRHHDGELAALLHREHHTRHRDDAAHSHAAQHIASAEQQLHGMISDLLAEAANDGSVRADVGPDELASYCLHALSGACRLTSKAAVRRLVDVVVTGLRLSG